MADPLILNPTLTLAGQAAAFNASSTGIELIIDGVTFGRAHYDPTGNEVALVNPVGSRIPFAGGSRPTPYQLRISSAWKENVGDVPIGEIGFWAGDVLVFVWSKANGQTASYKTDGVAYVMFADLAFGQVPANSITIVIDPDESAALAALTAHEGAANAHPQYLLREDVAKDVGPLMGLAHAAGSTANALVLVLDAPESTLPAYAKFQRFQFIAQATNTTAVTATIEGLGIIHVKRGGDTGLVELDPGDIKANSLYDLNYDGAVLQLGGGVGSGKAFERFSFVAGVAQSEFAFPHIPGSIIALRNGREFYDFASAIDGSKVTTFPMNVDDRLEFLAFRSLKVADTYTKAELTALLATAGALPVGSMLPMAMGICPPGYLEVDGDLFQDALYPDLAAFLAKRYNLGGDPVGYTRKPESRAEFFRGWDHGRGVDAGRAMGSYQADAFQGHWHALYGEMTSFSTGAVKSGPGSQPATTPLTSDAVRAAVTDGANGAPRTAAETRPRSLAVMWCIKAWNAPVNQGNIDIAALAADLAVVAANGPVVGSARGARMSVPVASATATFIADGVILEDAAGRSYRLKNFNELINLAAAVKGLGAMDVGAVPVNGYVAFYALYNPVTKLRGIMAVNATASAAPNLCAGVIPAGYSASARLTVVPTDASGLIKPLWVEGSKVTIGTISAYNGPGPLSATPLSLAGAVPLNAINADGFFSIGSTANGTISFDMYGSTSGLGLKRNTASVLAAGTCTQNFENFQLMTPQLAYLSASNSTGGTPTYGLNITGYSI
jgi:hypothetical protein